MGAGASRRPPFVGSWTAGPTIKTPEQAEVEPAAGNVIGVVVVGQAAAEHVSGRQEAECHDRTFIRRSPITPREARNHKA